MSKKNQPRSVAVVQARMGSRRLPNKSMLWLSGLPLVGWLGHRLRISERLAAVIFAIPDGERDQVLSHYLRSQGAQVFLGSESDVLDRIYKAGAHAGAHYLVRICADSPFTEAKQVDRLIGFYLEGAYDYAYNHIPKNNKYPDGLGAEILSMDLLGRIHKQARSSSQREHALRYIWDHQDKFKIGTFDPEELSLRRPELKLDIDNYEEYLRLLQMKVHPDMSAEEIINCFLNYEDSVLPSSF